MSRHHLYMQILISYTNSFDVRFFCVMQGFCLVVACETEIFHRFRFKYGKWSIPNRTMATIKLTRSQELLSRSWCILRLSWWAVQSENGDPNKIWCYWQSSLGQYSHVFPIFGHSHVLFQYRLTQPNCLVPLLHAPGPFLRVGQPCRLAKQPRLMSIL